MMLERRDERRQIRQLHHVPAGRSSDPLLMSGSFMGAPPVYFLHASELTWQPLNNHSVPPLSPLLHVLKITFTLYGCNLFYITKHFKMAVLDVLQYTKSFENHLKRQISAISHVLHHFFFPSCNFVSSSVYDIYSMLV